MSLEKLSVRKLLRLNFNVILSESLRNYGPKLGLTVLERRIDSYVRAGLTRSEAVRKVAEENGY